MNRSLGLLRKCRVVWATIVLGGFATFGAEQAKNSSPGPVSDGGAGKLSLPDAQRVALEKNWDLLAAAAEVDVATAQKIVASEFPNPTFSFLSSKVNVDHHPSSTVEGNGVWDRNYDTIFAVNQLFEIGGKRRNRKASAQAGFEMARAQFLDAKRTLDLAVAKAYVGAVQAEENARVLMESAETLHREAGLADVRLKAGEISSADKNQIEVTAERFELDAKAAQAAALQARIALEVLLGASRAHGEVLLSDSIETLSAIPAPLEANLSGTGRADVVAAEATLRKAEADLRLQKANRIPDPTVLAQYEHEPPDTPNSIGLGFSFPLPLWNRNKGNIRAAEAAREQARLAVEKAEAQAAAEIATARSAYDSALRRWQSYRDSIRRKSEQIRKAMAYAYEKGGASLLDLLIAERNDNEVRLSAAQAAGDTAVAAATFKAVTQVIQTSEVRK
jgi:cobalt-zinc-cadmium efflux system outer membrane protein